MTEQDWLECTDPQKMLALLWGKASDRKLRLFAAGCCRLVWELLDDYRSRESIEVAELVSDGTISLQELAHAREAAIDVSPFSTCSGPPSWAVAWHWVNTAAWECSEADAKSAARTVAQSFAAVDDPRGAKSKQAVLLRDIFGNPFCPITIDPAWLTPTVLSLAQAAYDNRNLPSGTLDTARLAVLADALEDAGCDNPDLLNHCCQPGEHVRGCWVVDLLLGKQ